MSSSRLAHLLLSEQGLIMPITMMVLVLLVSLTAAFAMLSASDPLIASNLKQGTEVMGLAEAGIEEAMWALSNPTAALWLNFPTMPPPDRYNGTWTAFGAGGYKITITGGPKEFTVTSEGRIPNDSTATVSKKITVTLWSLKDRVDPSAAFGVKGPVELKGNAAVDARNSTASACGAKPGVHSSQSVSISGSAQVHSDNNPLVANESADYAQNQPPSSFDTITLSQAELGGLKALAKANGTYYKGTQSFSSLPNGIVFVDTVSGNPIGSPPNASDLASVTITGATASGWLIVMGSLTMNGNVSYTGFVYVANDLILRGTGSGNGIIGAAINLNIVPSETSSSSAGDSSTTGNAKITFDCNAIKTGVATGGTGSATVPQGFFIKPGTWREVTS